MLHSVAFCSGLLKNIVVRLKFFVVLPNFLKKPEKMAPKRPQSFCVSTFELRKTPVFAKYRYQVAPNYTKWHQQKSVLVSLGEIWL